MEKTRLQIVLNGPAVKAHRIALKDFITITENVQKAITNIAQKIFKTEQHENSRIKFNVSEHCELELIGIFKGSLGIELGLKQQDVQPTIFEDIGEQALQLFLEGLQKLDAQEKAVPKQFDEKTLKNVFEMSKVFKKGINEIKFKGQIREKRTSTRFTLKTAQKIETLLTKEEIVKEQEIFGILWEADWKDHSAELYTNLGQKVIVKFDESFDEKIKEIARTRVKLKGKIKFENDRPKEIIVKEIEPVKEESAFKNSELSFVREPSIQKPRQDPFTNAKPIQDLSFFDELPDEWDVDNFVQTVYQMREEDRE